jgi:ribosomal protein S18 acetylase RimI-like enzyme
MWYRKHILSGVRPFDPVSDSRAVIELIALAFGDRLGPDGEIALGEMRRAARLASWLGWFYWPVWEDTGFAPGFVWVEEGRVLGNVSLRRAAEWGGFIIGNLAVHPDWRRKGIASALMEKALETISAQGGRWIGLEVRHDNRAALSLYERLGFVEVGRTLHMLRPAGLRYEDKGCRELPASFVMRRGQKGDRPALLDLLHTVIPTPQRALLELRDEQYRPGVSTGTDCWWIVENERELCGAVRAYHERGRRPDRLEILVAPGDHEDIEAALVQQGMASLRSVHKKMVESVLPNPSASLVGALEGCGFQRLRVLIQMRLDLARRIPVTVPRHE